MVLTLPMATAIRQRFPKTEVHFLLRAYAAPLAADHRDVDKIVVAPDSLEDHAAYDQCLREIRSEKYDLAIVVHSKGDVARLIWDAKIPFRMGSGLRLHSWRYNVPVFQRRRRPKQHELDYNLDMIREYVPVPAREEVDFRLRPDAAALLARPPVPRGAEDRPLHHRPSRQRSKRRGSSAGDFREAHGCV